MKRSRPTLFALATTAVVAIASCALARASDATGVKRPEGPLPTRNLDPRFAPFLTLISTGPSPGAGAGWFRMNAGAAHIYKGEAGATGEVSINAQPMEYRLEAGLGLTENLAISLDMPYRYGADPIKHGDYDYGVYIESQGVVLVDGTEPIFAPGDVRLLLDAHLEKAAGPVRRLRLTAALKAPTGRQRGFEGTGAVDVGLYVDGSLHLGGGVFAHSLIGGVLIGDVRTELGERLGMKNACPFLVGLEWRLDMGLGVHLQVEGTSDFFPESGHVRLDETPVQITAGATWTPVKWLCLYVAFSEDITRSVPDFTIWAGISVRFEEFLPGREGTETVETRPKLP